MASQTIQKGLEWAILSRDDDFQNARPFAYWVRRKKSRRGSRNRLRHWLEFGKKWDQRESFFTAMRNERKANHVNAPNEFTHKIWVKESWSSITNAAWMIGFWLARLFEISKTIESHSHWLLPCLFLYIDILLYAQRLFRYLIAISSLWFGFSIKWIGESWKGSAIFCLYRNRHGWYQRIYPINIKCIWRWRSIRSLTRIAGAWFSFQQKKIPFY